MNLFSNVRSNLQLCGLNYGMPLGIFVSYDTKPTRFLISTRIRGGHYEKVAIQLDATDVPSFAVFDLRSDDDDMFTDLPGILFSDIRIDVDAGIPFCGEQAGVTGYVWRDSGTPSIVCCGEDAEPIIVEAPPLLEKRWMREIPSSTHLRYRLVSKQPDGTTLTLFEAPSQPNLLASYSWTEAKFFGGVGCEPKPRQ